MTGFRAAIAFAVAALVSAGPSPAGAADAVISTGTMFYGSRYSVLTDCWITNVGTKPLPITSTAIVYAVGTTVGPSYDDCTAVPLPPKQTCFFQGDNGSYGGGLATIKGNPAKTVRARCYLFDKNDPAGPRVDAADMR